MAAGTPATDAPAADPPMSAGAGPRGARRRTTPTPDAGLGAAEGVRTRSLPGPAGPTVAGQVTLRDVARLAGVHPGTASRALNPQTRALVNAATAERVVEAARRLVYRPNPAARSLKTRRSYTIGVLIPDLTNPLFPPIIRAIEDHLAAHGYVALIGSTDNDAARERLIFDGMRSRHVDGFILATARHRHPLLGDVADAETAVVLVNRLAEHRAFPSASVDDALGVRLAVAHLAALGHRHIGHVAGPQSVSTGIGRQQGFRAGMLAVGLAVDPQLVLPTRAFAEHEGQRACRALLARGRPVTAIVAGNDLLALGCYAALEAAGLRCPDDVSVVGFNDMPFIDRLRPPLTSVRIPHAILGEAAARLVLERIANRRGPVTALFLSPELVVRGSTAPPSSTAGPRPPLARAAPSRRVGADAVR